MARVRPAIFRELLDLEAVAAATAVEVKVDELPRMAKFAKNLRGLDLHRGTDALGRYCEQLREVSETILPSNPLVDDLRAHISSFHGTSEELLTKMEGLKSFMRPPSGGQ